MKKKTYPSFESQKRFYDKTWHEYLTRKRKNIFLHRLLGDSFYGKCINEFVISRIKKIKATKSKQHTLKIIDMGCGAGRLTKILAEYGDVVGIDLSVEAAKKLYPDLKFKQVNIITEEIEGKYDIAVSTEVLEHFTSENQQIYILKALDILKEGGYLILTTPNKRSDAHEKLLKKYYKSPQPIENWIDKKSLISLLEQHDFKIRFIGSSLFSPVTFGKYPLFDFAYGQFYTRLYKILYKLIFKSLEPSDIGIILMAVAQKASERSR